MFKNNKTGKCALYLAFNSCTIYAAAKAVGSSQTVGNCASDLFGGAENISAVRKLISASRADSNTSGLLNSFCDMGVDFGLASEIVESLESEFRDKPNVESKDSAIISIQTCSDKLLRTLYLMQYNSSRQSPDEWILLDDLEM